MIKQNGRLDEGEDRETIDEWYTKAKEVQFDTLTAFMDHVMNDYTHDYGTVVHAIAACAVAAAWAADRVPGAMGGITGFQGSAVMWEFISHWGYKEPPMFLVEGEADVAKAKAALGRS